MRLLSTSSLVENGIVRFQDRGSSRYAILSHTWGEEEVTLQEMLSPSGPDQEKLGFKKILSACKQALQDGREWLWIDTCCIDKTSSAELSESINSMFQWYHDASICYAHLEGMPPMLSIEDPRFIPNLRECRWFTRGWTLQELVASKKILFFAGNWTPVLPEGCAVKSSLPEHAWFLVVLESITSVDRFILGAKAALTERNIAVKMSWAARRVTTRPEDAAYSLLGLFDVNMPLLYGEGGRKAFIRLQEEIMKDSGDHSIFAWKSPPSSSFPGALADKPAWFAGSAGIISLRDEEEIPFEMTNLGLRITLPMVRHHDPATPNTTNRWYAILNCAWIVDTPSRITIELQGSENSKRYVRLPGSTPQVLKQTVNVTPGRTIFIEKHKGAVLKHDYIRYRFSAHTPSTYKLHHRWFSPATIFDVRNHHWPLHQSTVSDFKVSLDRPLGLAGGISFIGPGGPFAVLVAPKCANRTFNTRGMLWSPPLARNEDELVQAFVRFCESWTDVCERDMPLLDFCESSTLRLDNSNEVSLSLNRTNALHDCESIDVVVTGRYGGKPWHSYISSPTQLT